jgi:hypothetical protein
MARQKCEGCGGLLKYIRSDAYNSYYECPYCGELVSISLGNDGNATLIYENAKNTLFARLSRGFDDWQVTQWDQLYRDFVDFTSAHEHLQSVLQFQMAMVACLTKGFNSMDAEKYQQCKTLFKITDEIYKKQLKELKAQSKNPAYSATIGEYEASRAKYVKLHNDYVGRKLPWNLIR